MKYFIKNKIPQAALKFKIFDRAEQEQGLESEGLSKSYTVTYDGFVKALNKLQLPRNLHDNHRVYRTLFQSFGGNPLNPGSEISYKTLLDSIAIYEYDPYETTHTGPKMVEEARTTSGKRSMERSRSVATIGRESGREQSSRLFKIEDPRNMALIDRRTAATNTLEKIFTSTKNVIQSIKEHYGVKTSAEAQKLMEEKVGVIDATEVVLDSHLQKNGKVAKLKHLKEFIKESCAQEFSTGKLKASDLMGFLSSVSINPKHETFYLNHISRMFDLDQNKLMRVVYDGSNLGPPPPVCKNYKNKQPATEQEIPTKRLNDIKFKLAQLSRDPTNLFWKFDPDHDGYASYDDMAHTFKRLLLCKDEQEGLKIVSRFDPSLKGYLSFDDFVKAFELNEFVPESCIYCPDRDHDKRHQSESKFDIKKAFVEQSLPSLSKKGILIAPTRFGLTMRPETFTNFREDASSIETKKHDPVQSKVDFQIADKTRKLLRDKAVFARKQEALSRYENNLAEEVARKREQDMQRVQRKAQRLLVYEAMNHN